MTLEVQRWLRSHRLADARTPLGAALSLLHGGHFQIVSAINTRGDLTARPQGRGGRKQIRAEIKRGCRYRPAV